MEEKYWKQFESSGKIEDYLNFVSHRSDTAAQMNQNQMEAGGHAGTYICDGNDTEGGSGGGVRQTHYPINERTW